VGNLKEKPGNISNFQFMTDEKIRKLSVCLSSKTSVILPNHLLGYDTSSYLLLFSAHGCNVPVKVAMPLSNVSVPKGCSHNSKYCKHLLGKIKMACSTI